MILFSFWTSVEIYLVLSSGFFFKVAIVTIKKIILKRYMKHLIFLPLTKGWKDNLCCYKKIFTCRLDYYDIIK